MNNLTNGESVTVTPKSKSTFSFPQGQINLAGLGLRMASAWQTNQSTGTFGFITLNDFQAKAQQFDTDIRQKRDKLAARKILTADMSETMKSVANNQRHLRAYIVEKYGASAANSHFADFGIVVNKGRFAFPKDKDELLVSLNQAVNALNLNPDLGSRTYGTSYWKDLRDKLTAQWNEAALLDSTLGTLTATLHSESDEIKTLVRRMKNQIKLDNPDSHKQIWRAWGLQQEKS